MRAWCLFAQFQFYLSHKLRNSVTQDAPRGHLDAATMCAVLDMHRNDE